jgi:hAT family protein
MGQILSSLKTGTAREARDFDDLTVKPTGPLNGVVKVCLLVLWICKTTPCQEFWDSMTAKIIQFDVDTQWNLTYNMIGDTIWCKAELIRLGRAYPDVLASYTLTTDDWLFVEQLHNVLKLFNEFTKLVSSGQPTITITTGIYFGLSTHLKLAGARKGKYAEYDHVITNAVHSSLELFNKYYNTMDQNLIYYIASVLDPQIKGVWIQREHQDGDAKLAKVQETIHKLYPPTPPCPHEADNNHTIYTGINSSLDALQALFAHINQDDESESDVDLYFKTPVVKHHQTNSKDDLNWILNWWWSHEAEYPIMSQVAQDYLAIPAS